MRGANAASAASPPRRDRDAVADPATAGDGAPGLRSNLALRVMAALVLAPLAIAAAWFGGWFWLGLVTITVVGLFGEWLMIVGNLRRPALLWGFLSLAACRPCARASTISKSPTCASRSGCLRCSCSRRATHRSWSAIGLAYTAAALFACVLAAARSEPRLPGADLRVPGGVDHRHPGLFRRPRGWRTETVGARQPEEDLVGRDRRRGRQHCCLPRRLPRAGYGKLGPMLLLATVISVISQLGDLFESAAQAPVRREGFEPDHPGPRRPSGPARWIYGGDHRCCGDRLSALRDREHRSGPFGMVIQ